LRGGMCLAAAGAAVGITLALMLTSSLLSLLFEGTRDPAMLTGPVPLALGGSAAASYLRRGTGRAWIRLSS
jgi:multidrug efflux pump subunit AcrB